MLMRVVIGIGLAFDLAERGRDLFKENNCKRCADAAEAKGQSVCDECHVSIPQRISACRAGTGFLAFGLGFCAAHVSHLLQGRHSQDENAKAEADEKGELGCGEAVHWT
jgi:hypothetical protein